MRALLGAMLLVVLTDCASKPPSQAGRTCEPFDDAAAQRAIEAAGGDEHDPKVAKQLERWHGCSCHAQGAECGPFPCTPNGCVVEACAADSDCAVGLCSSHASWPNGWCVASDPH